MVQCVHIPCIYYSINRRSNTSSLTPISIAVTSYSKRSLFNSVFVAQFIDILIFFSLLNRFKYILYLACVVYFNFHFTLRMICTNSITEVQTEFL